MNTEEWVKILGATDSWNERHLMVLFSIFGIPDGYFDVGSGTGAMVNLARKIGVEAFGIDQLPRTEHWLYQRDLKQPFEIPYPHKRSFDLVSCIEVAEHLPPEFDSTIVDTIVRHARKWIVFTSAHPGQGGDDHVGTRPLPHWRKLFWDRGWTFDNVMTSRVSLGWLNIQTPHYWLPNNVQVFHL